jgi:hypothetical protein
MQQKFSFLVICLWLASVSIAAKPIQHFIFFGQDREKLKELASVFDVKTVAGAQVAYSWRQLESGKDQYDFSLIRADLAFLSAKGKKLFVQLQDVSFSEARINVPRYLTEDATFHGE